MRIRHVGLNEHRFKDNPAERIYANEWKKRQDYPNSTLGYLLYGQDTWRHAVTQEDATAAATIIQWLGSPVGQGFIEECQAKVRKVSR